MRPVFEVCSEPVRLYFVSLSLVFWDKLAVLHIVLMGQQALLNCLPTKTPLFSRVFRGLDVNSALNKIGYFGENFSFPFSWPASLTGQNL